MGHEWARMVRKGNETLKEKSKINCLETGQGCKSRTHTAGLSTVNLKVTKIELKKVSQDERPLMGRVKKRGNGLRIRY